VRRSSCGVNESCVDDMVILLDRVMVRKPPGAVDAPVEI